MGQTGFCEKLRFPAIFCEIFGFLQFSAKSAPPNAANSRKSKKYQKSAKICIKLRIWLGLSLLVCPFSLSFEDFLV